MLRGRHPTLQVRHFRLLPTDGFPYLSLARYQSPKSKYTTRILPSNRQDSNASLKDPDHLCIALGRKHKRHLDEHRGQHRYYAVRIARLPWTDAETT